MRSGVDVLLHSNNSIGIKNLFGTVLSSEPNLLRKLGELIKKKYLVSSLLPYPKS